MDSQLGRFWDDGDEVKNADEIEVDELEANDEDENIGDARADGGGIPN
jgi:hypothetical protein